MSPVIARRPFKMPVTRLVWNTELPRQLGRAHSEFFEFFGQVLTWVYSSKSHDGFLLANLRCKISAFSPTNSSLRRELI